MSTSSSAVTEIESWYREYAVRLRGATKRLLGNADDAEDALHDAFVSAVRSYARYNGGDVYPWLYRIATRKALNILAARAPDGGDVAAMQTQPSAEEEALQSIAQAELAGLLRAEPALALHLVGGFRFREVGERLGTPLATAATRIRRGKARVRAQLQATIADFPRSRPA